MKLSYGIVFSCLFMISNFSHAQSTWTAIDEVDAFTDEEIKAVVYEDETHRIQISKENEKTIAMYLSLKRGTFEPNTTLEIRVDKNPMMEMEPGSGMVEELLAETLGMPTYQWNPSTLVVVFASISNLIPTAPEDIETATNSCTDRMTQFLNGDSLMGRYYVSGTIRETFKVSLEGFKKAANQVFAIAELRNENPNCLK